MLGLWSRLMQLLLNPCSSLVSKLGVEVVATVPQLAASGCHCCRVDENDSSSLCVIAPRKCIESTKSDGDKELKLSSVPPLPPYFCDCLVLK